MGNNRLSDALGAVKHTDIAEIDFQCIDTLERLSIASPLARAPICPFGADSIAWPLHAGGMVLLSQPTLN